MQETPEAYLIRKIREERDHYAMKKTTLLESREYHNERGRALLDWYTDLIALSDMLLNFAHDSASVVHTFADSAR